MIKGRAISPGKAKGVVVKHPDDFSFLGGVDPATGDLKVSPKNISGKVFAFPKGKGSTVGSFVIYDLLVHGKAPLALVNSSAETIVTTGAVISSIPMVDGIDMDLLVEGDVIEVNGDNGTISIDGLPIKDAAYNLILSGERILLVKRSRSSRVFPSLWSLVSGKVEPGEDVMATSVREMLEETGISVEGPDMSFEEFYDRKDGHLWVFHPFLYRIGDVEPRLNHENEEFKWVTLESLKDMDDLVPNTYKVVRKMIKGI